MKHQMVEGLMMEGQDDHEGAYSGEGSIRTYVIRRLLRRINHECYMDKIRYFSS